MASNYKTKVIVPRREGTLLRWHGTSIEDVDDDYLLRVKFDYTDLSGTRRIYVRCNLVRGEMELPSGVLVMQDFYISQDSGTITTDWFRVRSKKCEKWAVVILNHDSKVLQNAKGGSASSLIVEVKRSPKPVDLLR